MRISVISLLSGVLASLLFAGTATAGVLEQNGPVPAAGKSPETNNPVYHSGKFEIKACEEQPINPDDLDAARVYLEFVLDCLNTSWQDQLTKARIPFSKPKFVTTSRAGVPTGCGKFPKGAQAVYCPYNKKITFLLDPGILSQATELFLFEVLAHEYGHHVQQLSGIMNAVGNRKYKNEKATLAAIRKIELQAECFSGAFIGSVWQALGRRESDFTYVAQAAYDTASHGKSKNIAFWLRRGFDAETPDVCNTFSAPAAKVS
ncbi:neutral zinc metallopeptidase [Streptosporangium sp. NPDC051022]|uniref:neutral zinc metallopeptidase n=1 Tax=Streptosporangium sp. NPDC051022 TaxID=3155752 RepID=UPI0034485BAD